MNKPINCWLPANWSAPPWVHAGITRRHQGYSQRPFDSFNLALHVGDNHASVLNNRRLLRKSLNLPDEPIWLKQVHGKNVTIARSGIRTPVADGIYTDQPNIVCAILTADCIPLLLCNKSGTQIAAVHVGWRGFCQQIISKTLKKFSESPDNLLAWIGPHISAKYYEVGDEVRTTCLKTFTNCRIEQAFNMNSAGQWQMDLGWLTKFNLSQLGVLKITNCEYCTYADNSDFYSYRRDNKTGRMSSLIWMDR